MQLIKITKLNGKKYFFADSKRISQSDYELLDIANKKQDCFITKVLHDGTIKFYKSVRSYEWNTINDLRAA